jgi:hypothetical protein
MRTVFHVVPHGGVGGEIDQAFSLGEESGKDKRFLKKFNFFARMDKKRLTL